MGGEICLRKGRERGPWYEIQCVKNDIISKESRGEDASYERGLLNSWAKYPGYKTAGDALRTLGKSTHSRLTTAANGLIPETKI